MIRAIGAGLAAETFVAPPRSQPAVEAGLAEKPDDRNEVLDDF